MLTRVVTDTSFAAIIQRVWTSNYDSINKLEHAKPIIFNFYFDLIDRFKKKGGKVIFTRNPSHNKVKEHEALFWPRQEYWNRFIEESGCPGYHFEDYPQLNQFFTPEWSHLATPDAKIYTKELVKILQQDGVL